MNTQERAAELYEKHKSIVEGITVNFAHKYRKDVEESLAQANLIFMQVFARHDDSKGDFRVRLLHLLPRRLVGTLRVADNVAQYCTRRLRADKLPPFFFLSCDMEKDRGSGCDLQYVPDDEVEHGECSFDYDFMASFASDDAAQVLREIENISGDVALEVGDTVNSRRALFKFRHFVRRKLRWSRERITKAFDELSGLRRKVAC